MLLAKNTTDELFWNKAMTLYSSNISIGLVARTVPDESSVPCKLCWRDIS
jgi:hypothetical protein